MQAHRSRAALAVATLALAACASHPSVNNPPVYSPVRPAYGNPGAYSQYGVVRSIEVVRARESTSGGGALAGAIVGAVIGRQFGGGSGGRAAGTAIGAVGGALIGNEIEKNQRGTRDHWRVVVDPERGGPPMTFEVPDDGGLRPGERVRVENNQIYRL